ncbi:MAG: polysaccharide biosynthesis/export family protein [Chitinophagaceae bacterium]|nr:polysaccharide biosynthesis/export family protein [Chitinophagaceae bacterium]
MAFTNATNDELKIRKGDVLNISVSSLSKLEDELFNTAVSSTSATSSGYEVGKEGEIYFHKVGKLTAEGLTRKQLKAKLEDELKPYLKEPMAVINFRNHHVTILGDISRPQILPMPEEKVSLLDVIAQSGTTTAMTALQRVLVIREKTIPKNSNT